MKLSIAVGSAVLLAASLGVATHAIMSQRRASLALAEASDESAGLNARQRAIHNELRAAAQAAADLSRQVEQARAARAVSPGVAAAESPPGAAWDPGEQGTKFMSRHPSVRSALEAYARARVHYRYAPFYAELGLRADQIHEFQSLMSGGLSMGAAGLSGPYSNRWLSLATAGPAPNSSEYKERLLALLGEDGLQKLGRYGLTIPARELVGKVAGELWSTEASLTPQQADDLIRIVTQQRSWQASMPGSRIPGYNWDAILAEAGSWLTEPQLAVLKGMQAREQYGQAINRTAGAKPAPHAQAKPVSQE